MNKIQAKMTRKQLNDLQELQEVFANFEKDVVAGIFESTQSNHEMTYNILLEMVVDDQN